MGKIMQGVFGGSRAKQGSQQQSTSSSSNVNNDYLKDALGGSVSNGTGANDLLSSLLGVNGSAAGNEALDNYKNSSGYDFTQKAGTDAITGSSAARGLLGSGGTLTAINDRAQNTANTFFGDYLNKLLGLTGAGTQAANTIAGAGNVQQSQSTGQSSGSSSTKPGIGGFLGSILGGIPGGK